MKILLSDFTLLIAFVTNAQTKVYNDPHAKTRSVSGSFNKISVSSGVQLYLTQQSQPILEEMHARAADTLNEATRGVASRAQRQLVTTLEQVKQNLIAAEGAAVAAPHTGSTRHGKPRSSKPVRARA